MYAVSEALTVLSWFENLPEHEQPPRSIWWSSERISEWLENVKEKRKEGRTDSPNRRSSYDRSEDVPMMENELIDRSGPYPVIRHD